MSNRTPVDGYKLVILDCPYDTWENPETQAMFGRMVGLKLRGFRPYYDYGALPVDTTDYVGRHKLICRDVNGSLVPVAGYKAVDLSRCGIHRVPFPALAKAKASGAIMHARVIEEILNTAINRGEELTYEAALTMDPALHSSREFADTIKMMIPAIQYWQNRDYRIPSSMCTAVIKVKADQFLSTIGFRPIQIEGGIELEPFGALHLGGEAVRPMLLKEFTPGAEAIAERLRFFWNSRLTIADDSGVRELMRAYKKAA